MNDDSAAMPTIEERRDGGSDRFLVGGGELGTLIRTMDWTRTPLGPSRDWPRSLKTAVRIMLTSRQPIWIGWGKQLTYFYNDAYKSIIGGKHPWALGKPTLEVWREIETEIGPMLETAMTGLEGTYVESQLLIMERNGYPEETYYTFSYSPIPDDDGAPGGIICANTDDTQRVIGQRQLASLRDLASRTANARSWRKACERSATALAKNAKDMPFGMIYVGDGDGQVMTLAGAWGVEAGEPPAPATLNDAAAGFWRIDQAFSAAESVLVTGLATKFPNLPTGAWRQPPLQAAVIPIATAEGERRVVLIVGLNPFRLFDADYRRFLDLVAGQIAAAVNNADAYQQQRKRAEALAELDRAKTAFFSNVSHEFRTPLTLMLGTLEGALAADDLPEARRSELAIAHRNSLRLLRLVNTLLDFSRVEAGRIDASYEPIDLAALTTELASNFRSACERAGLRLAVDCETLPEPVYVDREMWEKIVLNLLSNAFKFTLEGGIAVRLRTRDGQAVLTVSDTGTGIPREEQEKVFQRFHRIAGARGRTHEGTGIGLALVQELVWLHGGQVTLESEPGVGSTFAVAIPLGTAHLPAERIGGARRLVSTSLRARAFVDEALRWLPGASEADARLDGGEAPDATVVAAGARRRVLIVDDNADMRDYLTRLLADAYDVQAAADGIEALRMMAARRPELMLTDVMMPKLDGFGLLRAVRADPKLRDIPVIMLSARAGEEAQIGGLVAGADDYLVKPFSARELLARVESNLKMASVRKEWTAELQASEQRFRALVSATADVVYRMNPDWSEMRHLVGRDFIADTEDPNRSWLEKYIHPDDRERVMAAIDKAIRTKSVFEMEHRVRLVGGDFGWTFSRAVPLLDADGNITEWFGAATDITAMKHAESQRELLINELNHRVKNTLASVQSVAMQTLRNSATVAEFQDAFVSRLVALSRAHDLLTRSNWQSASFAEIVRQTLEPYGTEPARIRFDGPQVRLSPSAAVTLTMALHELATNAAKYGALSDPRGRIEIGWRFDGTPAAPALAIAWSERGGPEVAPPKRRGFGSRLIERGIAQELDGEVALDFDPAGVQCRIRLPLSERVSAS